MLSKMQEVMKMGAPEDTIKEMAGRTERAELEDVIYNSLRQGTLPSPAAFKDLKKRYSNLNDEDLMYSIDMAKKRVDTDKAEMRSFIDIEMKEITSELSLIEKILDEKISLESVNAIEKFEARIAESQRKYSHLEGDNLFAEMVGDYSLFLDSMNSKAESIRDDAIVSVNSSLDSLLLQYGSIKIMPNNLNVLKDMKISTNEHKEVLSKLGASPRIAVSLSKGIDEAISIAQEMIIKEKMHEQSSHQQRDSAYLRFTELRSDYYDSSGSADIDAIYRESLALKGQMSSFGDERAGEVDLFIGNLEKYLNDKGQLKSKKARSIIKKVAAAVTISLLSYGTISIGAAGLSYVHSSIDSAKERNKAEAAAHVIYSQQAPRLEQQKAVPGLTEPAAASAATFTSSDNSSSYEQPKHVKEKNLLEVIAESEPTLDYIIYINKNSNQTALYPVNSGTVSSQPSYVWNSIDGKGGPEQKEKDGDFKTPEGIYRIRAIKWIKNNQPMFGPVAMQLDYPNAIDQNLGRTGGQQGNSILLCGTGDNERINALNNGQDITNGSIVLSPDGATQLANSIENSLKSTIVIIEGQNRIDINYIREYFSR
jgi:hypothetical protein